MAWRGEGSGRDSRKTGNRCQTSYGVTAQNSEEEKEATVMTI